MAKFAQITKHFEFIQNKNDTRFQLSSLVVDTINHGESVMFQPKQ